MMMVVVMVMVMMLMLMIVRFACNGRIQLCCAYAKIIIRFPR
jgi:hypothetical protein